MNNVRVLTQVAQNYLSFVPDMNEVHREPLYDTNTYAAAGQTQLQFFTIPIGQGTSPQVGSGAKNRGDTNMDVAGMLPQGKNFLVQSIELAFYPSGPINLGTVDPAAATATFADDVYTFYKEGWLDFFVSSKSYLQQAPLMKFPPAQRLSLDSAMTDSTTASTTQLTTAQYASAAGALFKLDPTPILLTSNTNFQVSLNWPSVVALPSSATAVVVCTLGGMEYRRVQ